MDLVKSRNRAAAQQYVVEDFRPRGKKRKKKKALRDPHANKKPKPARQTPANAYAFAAPKPPKPVERRFPVDCAE